ncbi:hypothetical protein [Butyrivibrio fibrisolvens]|uniref:hypothetical protein n=1 Tax=Butyrivibrio fibrisolvens TaxID=831 RepID=UPI0003F63FE1|nr:hypothetical protein [Butyrivibrio fibrisolvens]
MKRKIIIIAISMCILSGCAKSNASSDVTVGSSGSIVETPQDTNADDISTSDTNDDNKNASETDDEGENTSQTSQTDDANIEIDTSKIIEEQSFDIQLNEWGAVRFVSCMPEDTNPNADATFYLMEGEKVIYKMPSVYENDIRDSLFEDISFVTFKDINDDQKDEVIVGVHYVTGAGPQGVIPRTEVRIFEDKGESFEYAKELSDFITVRMPDDGTIHDVYTNVNWYELCSIDRASLYQDIQEVENVPSHEGDWKATNCHSSVAGSISIKNQTEDGFSFEGFFSYYSHAGEIIGNAHWVSETMAICNQDDIEDTMADGYMVFMFEGNLMYVIADTDLGMMGMNVSPDHVYTLGDPVYTNADTLATTYTEDELTQIHQLLGDDLYDDPFLFGTNNGCVTVEDKALGDGSSCKYVDCFIPTMNESYTAIITEDGRIYILIQIYNEEKIYTNDPAWNSNELPEVL